MLFALQACDDTNNTSNNESDVGSDVRETLDQSSDVKTNPDDSGSKDIGIPDATSSDSGTDVRSEEDSGSDQGNAAEFIFDENFDANADYKTDASDWTLLNPERSTRVGAENGSLVIIPEQTQQNGWYEDNQSSLLFRPVTGDFIVEASIKVSTMAGDAAPEVGYNSAGFVIRDGTSTQGSENWIMYNIGAQSRQVPFGVEVKTTVNSNSVLELFAVDDGSLTLEMRVCRIGNAFRYFQRPANTDMWMETLPSTPHVRDDFPATIDVGLEAGSWSATDVQGTFDWIRAWAPTDCTEDSP